MKAAIILALVACACATPLLTSNFVAEINSKQSQWVAGANKFTGMSVEEIKSYLGTNTAPYTDVNVADYSVLTSISAPPAEFDSRTQWPNCVHPIRDQARCGSCWAFGASEAFSDRVCIASQGATDVVLSPQWLVSCDNSDMGCQGGWLNKAWAYIAKNGLPTDTCAPYTSGTGVSGKCPAACADGSAPTFIKAKNVRTFATPSDAQADILTNGPIETGFTVYSDFMTYSSGIYKHTTGGILGGHAIKVVGWGSENGVDYWIAANSWGTSWGETGFFRIQTGQCGFEAGMIIGDPVL